MQDIFRKTTKIHLPNHKKQFEINWQIIFYIFVILVVIALFFVLINYFQKKAINQYKEEIISEQKELNNTYKNILSKSDSPTNNIITEGIELLKKNQTELAVLALEEALGRDSEIRDANILAGYSFLQLSQNNPNVKNNDGKEQINNYLEKAKKYLEKAKEIDPIDPQTYKLLSWLYFELDDVENANMCYNKFKDFENLKN